MSKLTTKQYKFPKEIGNKWVKALRSKKYKQATSYLKSEQGYCCLGVLGRVCGLTEKELDGKYWLRLYDVHVHGEDKNTYFEKKEELASIPGEVIGGDFDNQLVNELSLRNDKGISFKEIADWIEENVEFYEEVK